MSTRPFAELEDERVVIHAVKVDYVLTPGEIVALLLSCRSLWVVAVRRGRAWRRSRALAHREASQRQEANP